MVWITQRTELPMKGLSHFRLSASFHKPFSSFLTVSISPLFRFVSFSTCSAWARSIWIFLVRYWFEPVDRINDLICAYIVFLCQLLQWRKFHSKIIIFDKNHKYNPSVHCLFFKPLTLNLSFCHTSALIFIILAAIHLRSIFCFYSNNTLHLLFSLKEGKPLGHKTSMWFCTAPVWLLRDSSFPLPEPFRYYFQFSSYIGQYFARVLTRLSR